MKLIRINDAPLGSLVRITVPMYSRFQGVRPPTKFQSQFVQDSLVIGRLEDRPNELGWTYLGWKKNKALDDFHPIDELRNRLHTYLLFNYQQLVDCYWSIDNNVWCLLPANFPDQKCSSCQIPLPHIEQLTTCSTCHFLEELD